MSGDSLMGTPADSIGNFCILKWYIFRVGITGHDVLAWAQIQ